MINHFENFISRFSDFETRYKQFAETHAEEIYGQFKSQFMDFHNNYKILNEFIEESALYWSKNFNIFNILDRGELEVRTHTPFLAELLNPHGCHGQKNLFLKAFLTKLIKLPENEAIDPNWCVQTEKEYIDLRVENYALKKSVFIENKIRIGAHGGQLSRYYKLWIEGYCKGNGAFIYLSPDIDKNSPSHDGFDEDIFSRKKVLEKLLIWSYQDEIYHWLSEAVPFVKSPRVKETLIQYTDAIKNF